MFKVAILSRCSTALLASAFSAALLACSGNSPEEAARSAAQADFDCDTLNVTVLGDASPIDPAGSNTELRTQDVLVVGCGRSAIYRCSRSSGYWSCHVTDQVPG